MEKLKNQNVFFIDKLYFLLPEDFEGSFTDALRLTADHFEKIKAKKNDITIEKMWGSFLEDIPEKKLQAAMNIGHWNAEKEDWDEHLKVKYLKRT